MQDITGRFKDAPWFKGVDEPVIIGGAGGIGSWLALFLERGGFKTLIYDNDTIEEHNIGGQMFSLDQIGELKVEAVANSVEAFAGTRPGVMADWYEENSLVSKFMFSAFDNMEARKIMFNNWRKSLLRLSDTEKSRAIFIDARLRFEQLQVFCVTHDKLDKYEEYLFDDSEVEPVACTMKQTSHTAAMISSYMMTYFTNHVTNLHSEDMERDYPFLFESYLPINYSSYE